MIASFSIVPLGKGEGVSPYIARCMRVVEESGLPHSLTPMATVIEGEWEEVMEVIGRCRSALREDCDRVLVRIDIDDRKGREREMASKLESVRAKL